jgi:hypothetical protein
MSYERAGPGFVGVWRLAFAVLVGIVVPVCLVSCSNHVETTAVPATAPSPSVARPLATSVETADGSTWATVAMGDLSQPLNTFWQLFTRPAGAATWTDQVEATGVATNGGLVLAPARDRSLTVGVLPSDMLTFSPLIATENGGRAWTDGLLAEGLSVYPNALAAGPTGRVLALTNSGSGTQSVLSSENLSSWQTIASGRALGTRSAGQLCGVAALDAVAYDGAAPVIGAACTHAGVVGLFTSSGEGWRLIGPTLPGSLSQGSVSVTALDAGGKGLSCLLTVTGRSKTSLVAAFTIDNGRTWRLSRPLRITASETVSSVGSLNGSGFFVLLADSSGTRRAEVLDGRASGWEELPTPPAGTATLAFGPGTTVESLAVSAAVLTVWTLGPRSSGWHEGQVIQVPIEYGSSS